MFLAVDGPVEMSDVAGALRFEEEVLDAVQGEVGEDRGPILSAVASQIRSEHHAGQPEELSEPGGLIDAPAADHAPVALLEQHDARRGGVELLPDELGLFLESGATGHVCPMSGVQCHYPDHALALSRVPGGSAEIPGSHRALEHC